MCDPKKGNQPMGDDGGQMSDGGTTSPYKVV